MKKSMNCLNKKKIRWPDTRPELAQEWALAHHDQQVYWVPKPIHFNIQLTIMHKPSFDKFGNGVYITK